MRKLAFFATLIVFAFPVFAAAESVVWSSNIPGTFFVCGPPGSGAAWYGYDCYSVLQNVQTNVAYNVQATDDTTGTDACNATVPEGTQIDFQFVPHVSQDISWFGSGFDMDSPYGSWSVDALSPPAGGDPGTAPNPSQWCNANNYLNTWGYAGNNSYVLLEVNPPSQQQLADTQGLTCGTPGADGSVSCTASQPGTVTPTFQFGSTYGQFYFAVLFGPMWPYGCDAYSMPLATLTAQSGVFGTELADNPSNSTYTLQVPAQQISCPITVTAASGTPPTAPTVGGGGGQSPSTTEVGTSECTVGEPYTISFSSIDPSGAQVKYGIDWDDSGTIEEYVPSSGYVPSGTVETASRTFAVSGEQTIKVIAIDSNGFSSPWTTFTTMCSGTTEATSTEIIEAGGTEVGTGQQGVSNYSPALQISATPSILKPGESTTVSWNASNVTASTCFVTGSNGDGGQGAQGWIGALSSGIQSSPINNQTVYTLSCIGLNGSPLTQSTTVNIIPTFDEH